MKLHTLEGLNWMGKCCHTWRQNNLQKSCSKLKESLIHGWRMILVIIGSKCCACAKVRPLLFMHVERKIDKTFTKTKTWMRSICPMPKKQLKLGDVLCIWYDFKTIKGSTLYALLMKRFFPHGFTTLFLSSHHFMWNIVWHLKIRIVEEMNRLQSSRVDGWMKVLK